MRSAESGAPEEAFPRGSHILVKPTPYELSEGILIPGHRFDPLRPLETQPWRIEVFHDGSKASTKKTAVPVRHILMYYSFFPATSMYRFLAEDDGRNMDALDSSNELARVNVRAFALADLCGTTVLAAGDYLEFTQEDDVGLSFSVRPRRRADIDDAEREDWLAALAAGFRAAMERLRVPGDNLELIRAAYVASDPSLLSRPGGSLSDFLNEGHTIEFHQYAGESYLWATGADLAEVFAEAGLDLPEDASELDRTLAELGLSLDEADVETFVRDELAHGGDLATALDRCFAGLDVVGYDAVDLEPARRLALDFAEATRSRIAGTKEKAAITRLRSELLATYGHFLSWMRKVGGHEEYARDLVKSEAFQSLAGIMQNIVIMLNILNHPEDCDATFLRSAEAALPSIVETATRLLSEVDSPTPARATRRGGEKAKGRKSSIRPKPNKVYVFEMRIADIDPPIRRLVAVPGNRRLDELHGIIQQAFGWDDCHLHFFEFRGQRYATPSDDDFEPVIDESGCRLDELSLRARSRILYRYDFGDDWLHELVIKIVLPFKPDIEERVVCMEGARAAPPEDCGGPPGYADLLAAIRRPPSKRNEDERELVAWAGRYDPSAFDLKRTNARLGKL